jgi:hypothetical protein
MLNWSSPAYDGGAPLGKYILRACDQTTNSPCDYAGPGEWSGSTPWGNFTPGDNVQYSVVAYSADGPTSSAGSATSAASAFSDAVSGGAAVANFNYALPSVGPPSAPQNVSAGGGFSNGAVTITWTSPSSNGNAPVTGYNITYYDTLNGVAGQNYSTTVNAPNDVQGSTGYSDTIGVSAPGTWTFIVNAVNAAGYTGSSASTTALYRTLNPVNNFYVLVYNWNAVTFNWNPPTYNGNGSNITYFLRACDLTSGPPCAYSGPGAWDGNPAQVPWGNWTLGHTFQFSVVGTTGGASTFDQAVAQGNGVANFNIQMPPSGDPDAPRYGPAPNVAGVSATSGPPGSGTVNLSWYQPDWWAYSWLRGYYVSECNLTAGGCYADPNGIPSSGGYTGMTFGGLTPGDTYEFSVVALLNGGPTASATSFYAATSTDGAPTATGYAVAG